MKATLDSIRSYLTEISRTPLLSSEQEIVLGRKVQKLQSLLSIKERLKVDLRREPTRSEWAQQVNSSLPSLERDLTRGQEAKEQLIIANLRLVVSIAKKYQARGLELLDLIQEGNTGLIVAAERFDQKKGYKDLKTQERKVLVLYYGLNSEPQSCQKIATQFGISRQAIRQKKDKAPSLILSRLTGLARFARSPS